MRGGHMECRDGDGERLGHVLHGVWGIGGGLHNS